MRTHAEKTITKPARTLAGSTNLRMGDPFRVLLFNIILPMGWRPASWATFGSSGLSRSPKIKMSQDET